MISFWKRQGHRNKPLPGGAPECQTPMVESGMTKGYTMSTATITHVFAGIERTTVVEDEHRDTFYARVVGSIQGIAIGGDAITKLEIEVS